MNQKREFSVPLYYSLPLLAICLIALSILVFLFRIEPDIFLQPLDAINVSSCTDLNQNNAYYILNQSISFNSGTCIQITGNNTILDGEFRHLISGNGGADDVGVYILGENVSVLRVNVTKSRIGILTSSNDSFIFNNFINATYGTGIGAGIGASRSRIIGNYISHSVSGIAIGNIFNFVNSYNHIVQNNTIYGNSIYVNDPIHNGFDFGISLAKVQYSNITGNIIYKPNALRGVLINYSDYNLLLANRLDGPFVNGINYVNSISNFISETEIHNSLNSAIHVSALVDNVSLFIKNLSVINTSSSYYDLEVSSPYSNVSHISIIDSSIASYKFNQARLVFRSSENAQINFTTPITASGNNLTDHVKTRYNYAEVKSNLNSGLNKSATVTFFGIPTNITNVAILRGGNLCPQSVCVNLTSLNASTVIFNVTGWTNYTLNYTFIDTTPQILTINEPDENERYTLASFPVTYNVMINGNGSVKFSLNNGSSNVTMNSADNRTFTYVQNFLGVGSYTFTAYANFSNGTKINSFVRFSVVNTTGSSTSGSSSGGGATRGGTSGVGTTGGNGTTGSVGGSVGGTIGGSSSGTTGGASGKSLGLRNTIYWLIISVILIIAVILVILIVRALREKIAVKNKTQFNISSPPTGQLVSNLR